MASRRKSMEEKNLKILRELAAFPANKQCFDCHQRGPTYINMTIGSFVCTSCSGLLRGLTPPHRVKSITMTMFTQDEIEFLRSRGNEYCKHVWLGTYDSRAPNPENDSKDDLRKKDLMVQKYEKKRWYVDPDIATKKLQQEYQFQQKSVHTTHTPVTSHLKQFSRVPEVQPLSQLFGKTPAQIVVENNQVPNKWPHPVSSASAPHTTTKAFQSRGGEYTFDLLAEFGTNTLVSPSSKAATGTSANGNFANFDSAFNSSFSPERRKLPSSQSSNNHLQKSCAPPSGWTSFEDDLDPLSPTTSSSMHSVSSASAATCSSLMPRPLSLPTFVPTNPFKTFPTTNSNVTSQWKSFAVSSGSSTIPASASLDAYPSLVQLPKKDHPRSALPDVSSPIAEKPAQDRYAALADLDISYNNNTSSWSTSMTVTTSVATTSTASMYGFSATETSSSDFFNSASSNPFATSTMVPWPQPTTKSFAPVNPFQSSTDTSLPFQQPPMNSNYAPLPVVGSSPSEDAQFAMTNNLPFAAFNTSSSNGYNTNPSFTQNGVTTSSGFNAWGMTPSSSMPASLTTSQNLVQASGSTDKRMSDFSQYSNWAPTSANPFMAGSSNAHKSSSSNPFL